MSSGAKVVLAMVGGALAVALIAVAAFLLTDEPKLLCVEGELQDNQIDPNGRFLPRTETFATVGEAESFVCRLIPHPRNTAGLTLNKVEVFRTTNLGKLIEGEGRAIVTFRYSREINSDPSFTLEVSFPSLGAPELEGSSPEPATVAGQEASLVRTAGATFVYWTDTEIDFAGSSEQNDAASLDQLLNLLNSIR